MLEHVERAAGPDDGFGARALQQVGGEELEAVLFDAVVVGGAG